MLVLALQAPGLQLVLALPIALVIGAVALSACSYAVLRSSRALRRAGLRVAIALVALGAVGWLVRGSHANAYGFVLLSYAGTACIVLGAGIIHPELPKGMRFGRSAWGSVAAYALFTALPYAVALSLVFWHAFGLGGAATGAVVGGGVGIGSSLAESAEERLLNERDERERQRGRALGVGETFPGNHRRWALLPVWAMDLVGEALILVVCAATYACAFALGAPLVMAKRARAALTGRKRPESGGHMVLMGGIVYLPMVSTSYFGHRMRWDETSGTFVDRPGWIDYPPALLRNLLGKALLLRGTIYALILGHILGIASLLVATHVELPSHAPWLAVGALALFGCAAGYSVEILVPHLMRLGVLNGRMRDARARTAPFGPLAGGVGGWMAAPLAIVGQREQVRAFLRQITIRASISLALINGLTVSAAVVGGTNRLGGLGTALTAYLLLAVFSAWAGGHAIGRLLPHELAVDAYVDDVEALGHRVGILGVGAYLIGAVVLVLLTI